MKFIYPTIAIILTTATSARALDVPYCDELVWEECLDDVLSITSMQGADEITGATIGSILEVQTSIDVRSALIQGWSFGVHSDPQYFAVSDTSTTTADALVQNASFNFHQPAVSSNDGFIQAVVLSFTTATYLPIGEMGLVMMTSQQDVIAAPPSAGSTLEWADGLVGSGQPVAFLVVVDGEGRVPRKVKHLTVYP